MDINKMTRKQFEELPYLDDFENIDVDSIVLLPSKEHHDSGFNLYEVVACLRWKPIGKCYSDDTFSIFMEGKYNRVGIDCLRGSGLMRIFLPPDEYYIDTSFHQIKRKADADEKQLKKTIDLVETINGIDLKPMWDKWREEMTKQIKETLKGEKDGKETKN